MFEKQLQTKLETIFGVKKSTFDPPSTSREQDVLFIDIQDSKNKISDDSARAKVTGSAFLIARGEKIPFGFFSKAIAKANPALTKDLFFYDFETNPVRMGDLVQRGVSFIYFFDSQFDPPAGNINAIDITVEEQDS